LTPFASRSRDHRRVLCRSEGDLAAIRNLTVPLLIVLALSGCSSGPAINTGPLGNGGNGENFCTGAAARVPLDDTFTWLHDSGKSPVVITRIGLYDPSDMILVGADTDAAGANGPPVDEPFPMGGRFPPVAYPTWRDHQTAVGTVINPGRTTFLLLGLERTGKIGRVVGVDVWYSSGGNAYEMQAPQGATLVPGGEWLKECPG